MRLWVIFLAGAPFALGQPFSFGVKGGVPLTDFLSATNGGGLGYFTTTNRYIVGPTAELRLPFGLGVEFDALYRHLNFNSVSNSSVLIGFQTVVPGQAYSSTTSGAWEFPLLVKYRFPTRIVRPYVDAGVVWDKLSGLTQLTYGATPASSTSRPSELRNNTVTGFAAGVGRRYPLALPQYFAGNPIYPLGVATFHDACFRCDRSGCGTCTRPPRASGHDPK
jgi:hypothetical protein